MKGMIDMMLKITKIYHENLVNLTEGKEYRVVTNGELYEQTKEIEFIVGKCYIIKDDIGVDVVLNENDDGLVDFQII